MIWNVHGLLLTSVMLFLSAAATFFTQYYVSEPGYEHLYLLPLLYGICFFIWIEPARQRQPNLFIYIFIAVIFTRYVLLPALIPITGLYDGRSSISPAASSVRLAIWLMGYELLIVSFFVGLIFGRRKPYRPTRLTSPRSYAVYVVFILGTLGLGVLQPASFAHFSFLSVKDEFERFEELSQLETLVTFMLVTAKFLAFVLVMDVLRRWRDRQKRKSPMPFLLSFIVVCLNILVFFGENRADYIITSIASLVLFYRLYPRQFKVAVLPLGAMAAVVTSYIVEHRNTMNLQMDGTPLFKIANTLQVYLGGPYNVAIAVEATDLNGHGQFSNLIHELLRPVIGLNIFLKHYEVKTSSDYFNERIYFSDHVSQIIPMVGQGYFYLGFVFAPLLMIVTLLLVRYLLKWQTGNVPIELSFFLMIPVARAGLGMGQNLSILMNDASFFLAFFLIIYWLNNRFVLKKPHLSKSERKQRRQMKKAKQSAGERSGHA